MGNSTFRHDGARDVHGEVFLLGRRQGRASLVLVRARHQERLGVNAARAVMNHAPQCCAGAAHAAPPPHQVIMAIKGPQQQRSGGVRGRAMGRMALTVLRGRRTRLAVLSYLVAGTACTSICWRARAGASECRTAESSTLLRAASSNSWTRESREKTRRDYCAALRGKIRDEVFPPLLWLVHASFLVPPVLVLMPSSRSLVCHQARLWNFSPDGGCQCAAACVGFTWSAPASVSVRRPA